MRLKPITIKDFKVGQKIAVLRMHCMRNMEPELYERTVDKVGRKYVVDNRGTKYCKEDYLTEGLVENSEYGERAYIFPTKEEAEKYIEKSEILKWLQGLNFISGREYTLEQLRKVKEILEGD